MEEIIRRFTPAVADYPPVEAWRCCAAGDTGLAFESYPLIHPGSDGIRDFGHAYAAHLERRSATLP